jgi:hypothetical protein
MMYVADTAKRLKLVAKEQYGDRKEVAIEQCLNKLLTFALARQLKLPLAMCSNEAKLCYDRIVYFMVSGEPLYATYGCGRTTESVYIYYSPEPAALYPHCLRRLRAIIYRKAIDSPYRRRRTKGSGAGPQF